MLQGARCRSDECGSRLARNAQRQHVAQARDISQLGGGRITRCSRHRPGARPCPRASLRIGRRWRMGGRPRPGRGLAGDHRCGRGRLARIQQRNSQGQAVAEEGQGKGCGHAGRQRPPAALGQKQTHGAQPDTQAGPEDAVADPQQQTEGQDHRRQQQPGKQETAGRRPRGRWRLQGAAWLPARWDGGARSAGREPVGGRKGRTARGWPAPRYAPRGQPARRHRPDTEPSGPGNIPARATNTDSERS